jgi:hypothetical protein
MAPTVFAVAPPTRRSARATGGIPVDVFTVDPRHYVRDARMVEALDLLDRRVARLIERHEWSLRTDEGRVFSRALHVGRTPAIYINGEKHFENRVPTVDELYVSLLWEARTRAQRRAIEEAWAYGDQAYAEAA